LSWTAVDPIGSRASDQEVSPRTTRHTVWPVSAIEVVAAFIPQKPVSPLVAPDLVVAQATAELKVAVPSAGG
jgi:hypothetical protein